MGIITDNNIFLVLGLVVSIGLSLFGLYRLPLWKQRDFGSVEFKWKTIFASSTVFSFLVGAIVYGMTLNPWPSVAVIPLAYMTILGSITDMKVVKIPSDISIIAYWIPVPLLFIFADSYGWLSFGIWMAIVLLFTFFAYAGAFGFADLRIMILAGTSISWWIGAENILLAFGASALVQLMIYPLAHFFNWGVVKERKSISYLVKEKENEEKKNTAEEDTPSAEVKPEEGVAPVEYSENDEIEEPESLAPEVPQPKGKAGKFLFGKSDKAKRFVPFGPALMVAFCVVALYYAKFYAVYSEPHFGWWNS